MQRHFPVHRILLHQQATFISDLKQTVVVIMLEDLMYHGAVSYSPPIALHSSYSVFENGVSDHVYARGRKRC